MLSLHSLLWRVGVFTLKDTEHYWVSVPDMGMSKTMHTYLRHTFALFYDWRLLWMAWFLLRNLLPRQDCLQKILWLAAKSYCGF